MFIVDTALRKRAEQGKPIRVGQVGSGRSAQLETQLARADLLRSLGKPDEAISTLEHLVVTHPDIVDLGFTLAQHFLTCEHLSTQRHQVCSLKYAFSSCYA